MVAVRVFVYMKVLTGRKVRTHSQHVEYICRINAILSRERLVHHVAVSVFRRVMEMKMRETVRVAMGNWDRMLREEGVHRGLRGHHVRSYITGWFG